MNTTVNKLSMTKDSFVFSVHQAAVARQKPNGFFDSHLRFEPFLENTWTIDAKPTFSLFKKELGQIMEHHFSILPNYRRNEVVNLENIAWFSHSIAVLFADIEFLLMAYTGHGFPLLPTAEIPHATTSKNIAFAIKKHADFKHSDAAEKYSLFPLIDEQEHVLDDLYVQELWSLVAFFAKRHFGDYAPLITCYIEWKYVDKTVAPETVDWNVRPPCGPAYRKEFKELFEEERNKRFGGRTGKANHGGKFSNDRPKVGDGEKKEGFEKKDSFEKKGRFEKNDRSNRNDRKDWREKPFQSRQNSESDQAASQQMEQALDETRQAIAKLQANKNIPEIALTPQNSFIRREQHMIISQAGFATESRGDEQNRCVCIIRKES